MINEQRIKILNSLNGRELMAELYYVWECAGSPKINIKLGSDVVIKTAFGNCDGLFVYHKLNGLIWTLYADAKSFDGKSRDSQAAQSYTIISNGIIPSYHKIIRKIIIDTILKLVNKMCPCRCKTNREKIKKKFIYDKIGRVC